MRVFQIPVGPMENFAYLLMEEGSREALAVDSGWETEPITRVASSEKMRVKYVCATHAHYDHVRSIDRLAAELRAVTVAFEGSQAKPKVSVADGDALSIGGRDVLVMHTPGHTKDSVCYYDGENVFTGDTLFVDAWGRTDLPGGSPDELFASLHDVLMALPDETVVYPGHDYGEAPFRTLGEEAAPQQERLRGGGA